MEMNQTGREHRSRSRDGRSQERAPWRSLEELARTPRIREFLEREFPRQAAVWGSGLDRRRFLTLAGASLGLGGLTA